MLIMFLYQSIYNLIKNYFTENPFPHQGPVITIKLSEDTETENDDGSQKKFVEMLFEMNYESGNWRRLKRTRVVNQQGT